MSPRLEEIHLRSLPIAEPLNCCRDDDGAAPHREAGDGGGAGRLYSKVRNYRSRNVRGVLGVTVGVRGGGAENQVFLNNRNPEPS